MTVFVQYLLASFNVLTSQVRPFLMDRLYTEDKRRKDSTTKSKYFYTLL